jgi:WD40 repeat protein
MVGHTSSINDLLFSPDGARLASFSSSENLFWDTHWCRPVNVAGEGHVDHWRSVVNVIIDAEGWLCVHGRREIWIPEEYGRDFSPVEGVRRVGDSTTVCIGGSTGAVTFLRLPDRAYNTPFDA